jgi:lipopolysaccharide transport system ATP-binding protein
MNIIDVESVSKKYNLAQQSEAKSIRNGFSDFFKSNPKEEFWAVDNISFSLQKGDKLGIIGNNGAGKSTLLKILSRITKPTHGHINVRGKVASLLEVGTGFHPELTGRENIYLNGAILGMSKAEITSQFDQIVDFAGTQISQFLDTPVKRYSSGMYVRLGFAISAHLNPEILIVDDV